MDEFVHRPKAFRSSTPKIDQIMPPEPKAKIDNTLPIPEDEETADKEPKAIDEPPEEATKPIDAKPALTGSGISEPVDEDAPKNPDTKDNDSTEPPKVKKGFSFMRMPKFSKKKWLIIVGILLIIVIAAGAGYWFLIRDINQQAVTEDDSTVTVAPTPAPTPISPLTGVELASAELATRPVTGLIIENSYAARPQSGLVDAGIVFEALAEGGISRFLALYQEAQPQTIGPVRSLRPYYIDFGMAFDASIAHAGGSPTAISDAAALGTKNLNAFHYGGAFWRSSDRYSPHNLYSGFEQLNNLNASLGYTSSNFTPFKRKSDVPQTATASIIDVNISSTDYNSTFAYDAATNTYKRTMAGTVHVDAGTGAQISPKVVVALVMAKSYMADGSHIAYQTTGSGTMYIFQDGIVSTGTWSKADRTSSFVFTDKNGLPMQLNAGQTWITIIDAASKINYRP